MLTPVNLLLLILVSRFENLEVPTCKIKVLLLQYTKISSKENSSVPVFAIFFCMIHLNLSSGIWMWFQSVSGEQQYFYYAFMVVVVSFLDLHNSGQWSLWSLKLNCSFCVPQKNNNSIMTRGWVNNDRFFLFWGELFLKEQQ